VNVNSSNKFTTAAVAGSIFVGVATILEVMGAVSHLSERMHAIPIITVVLDAAFVVAFVTMWQGYREATGLRSDIALGKSRGEVEFIAALKSRICAGGISEVDIGGLALRANFFKTRVKFAEDLLGALRNDKRLRVRIWLLDPRPSAQAIRMREMAERERDDGLLKEACSESLETLRKIVTTVWNEQKQRRPEVVLVEKIAITHFIFRVDDEMLVCPYLQHGTGNSSPAVFLKKGDRWFDVYRQQFDICFDMHSDNSFPTNDELDSASPPLETPHRQRSSQPESRDRLSNLPFSGTIQ
jgi:hypothetical protein